MIPLSADFIENFTPPSLRNVAPKPVFRFRTATLRDQKRYGYLLTAEGLRNFPDEEIRAEVLRVLKVNWPEEVFTREKERLENIWAKMDQKIEISEDDAHAITELSIRCLDHSPVLRLMDADNKRFHDEAPGLALSMFLVGWQNVDVPFDLEDGRLSFEKLDALQKQIIEIERKAIADKVEGASPGMGFMELTIHAFSLLNFTKAEEKNSDAPSPSPETLNGSKASSQRDGASATAKAPKNSGRKKTPHDPSPVPA